MTSLKFIEDIKKLPPLLRRENAERWFESLVAKVARAENPEDIQKVITHPGVKELLAVVSANSPFLSKIILENPEFFATLCITGSDDCFAELKSTLEQCDNL